VNPLTEIRARRAHLMARAAVERERICVQLHALEAPLALVDKSIAAARYIRRHPQWILAALVLLAVLRPRRALSWARNGLIAWRSWRWISQSLRKLSTRVPA
jgi:YqjK-like protein